MKRLLLVLLSAALVVAHKPCAEHEASCMYADKEADNELVSIGCMKHTTRCELQEYVKQELHASYKYTTVAQYFSRPSVARRGFSKLFWEEAKRAQDNADSLLEFFNLRGAPLTLMPIDALTNENMINHVIHDETSPNITHSIDWLIKNEMNHLNKKVLMLHEQNDKDPHFQHYLEDKFLPQRVDLVAKHTKLMTMLGRISGDSFGVHWLDEMLKDGKW